VRKKRSVGVSFGAFEVGSRPNGDSLLLYLFVRFFMRFLMIGLVSPPEECCTPNVRLESKSLGSSFVSLLSLLFSLL